MKKWKYIVTVLILCFACGAEAEETGIILEETPFSEVFEEVIGPEIREEKVFEEVFEEIFEEAFEEVKELPAQFLECPGNFMVVQASADSVLLSWLPVEKADYYELFRKVTESGNWQKVKNLNGSSGSNLNLADETTYFYRIRAVHTENGIKQFGPYSDPVSIQIHSGKTLGLTVSQKSTSSARLEWEPVSGGVKYELFRMTDSNGKWSKVKTVYDTVTSNLNLVNQTVYRYKIRAWIEGTETSGYWGAFSDVVSFTPVSAQPKQISVTRRTANSVALTWSMVQGCDHYELFRDTNFEGNWKKIKNVTGESGTNLNLTERNTYSYKVRAVFIKDGVMYAGAFSDVVSILIMPNLQAPIIDTMSQVGTNRVYLSWNPVDHADFYRIYRRGENGKWIVLKETEETAVYNLALSEGVVYSYKVAAVCKGIMGEAEGPASNPRMFSLGEGFDIVRNVRIESSDRSKVVLTWEDSLQTVDGYAVYRRIPGENWIRIGMTDQTVAADSNLVRGNTYQYCIRSYRNSERGVVYSLASECCIFWNEKGPEPWISEDLLCWNPMSEATKYRVYANGRCIAETDAVSIRLAENLIGKKMTVSAVKPEEGKEIESGQSAEVLYFKQATTTYRALLIGENAYSTRLNGPDNDIHFMEKFLSGLSCGYEVVSQENATLEELEELISYAYEDATEDDVSLFYYSGHGVTGAGEHYSGAIQTVDYGYLTTERLAQLLSAVPGRIIVILDSCGSGAAITEPEEGMAVRRFNEEVVETFRLMDKDVYEEEAAIGELRQKKFHVITGSAYEQNSLTTMIDGIWGGVLTRGISFGLGCDYTSGLRSGKIPADTNADGAVSFGELADYCRIYTGDRQDVQLYSTAPDMVFFF